MGKKSKYTYFVSYSFEVLLPVTYKCIKKPFLFEFPRIQSCLPTLVVNLNTSYKYTFTFRKNSRIREGGIEILVLKGKKRN